MKKQWHIGIDGNEANAQVLVGSGVYALGVLQSLEKLLRDDDSFRITVYLSAEPSANLPLPRANWEYKVLPSVPLWTQWRLPWELWQRPVDLFFSPGHYLPVSAPGPQIASIMDLAYEKYPQQFTFRDVGQLKVWTFMSIKRASRLIAISKSTKNDIVELYGFPSNKIDIAYPAVTKKPAIPASVDELLTQLGIKQPYFIAIGTLQPRKNYEKLIGAFEMYRQQGGICDLVIVGKEGWLADPIVERMQKSPSNSHIIWTKYVSQDAKVALLHRAQALVSPGLYEGFGLPVLEAIEMSVLPLASNVSSLPEIVTFADLLFDPNNQSAIAERLMFAQELSAAKKADFIERLQHHCQQFTWEQAAKAVRDSWSKVLE